MRRCRVRPDLLAVISMALLALALMSPYWLQSDVLVWPRSDLGTDFLHYRWVHMYHFRRSLQEYGEVPLWRNGSLGGEPIVGNPAVMLFYPVQLLVALLPFPILPAFALQTAFHFWIAGMGTYVLLRQAMGLRRLAAYIGALALMLTPRLSSNAVGDVGMDYAMCWAPFCLAWAKLAIDQRRWAWVFLAGIGLALQFLLHVHVFFHTAWAIGLYFGYQTAVTGFSAWRKRQLGEEIRPWLAKAGRLALVALVCSGLAAFELLPFVTYLTHLSRETMTLSEANHYALPPVLLFSVAMPSSLKFPEWELYVGLLPLALAPLAILHPRRAEAGFWIVLAGFAVLFSLGTATPLFPLLYNWVPGFRWLRVPPRMWTYVAVAVAALIGLAVDALVQPSTRAKWGRRWRNWLLFSGWGLTLATVAGRWLTRRPGEFDWVLGIVGSLGLASGLISVWLWMRSRIGYAMLGQILIGALLLDLLPVDAAYMRPQPAEQAFQMPEIGKSLLDPQVRTKQPFRIYAVRGELPYHVAEREGLELVNGINSFQFESYIQFIKQASGCTLPGFAASVPPCLSNEVSATAYRDAIPDPGLLGLFNVKYVITPLKLQGPQWALLDAVDGEYLYENLAVLPRAFGVGGIEWVPSRPALWQRLAQVDVSQVALVEGDGTAGELAKGGFHVPAEILEFQPNRMRIDVEMPGDGMLVVGEVWTPGWQATDNGAPAQVLRVNGAMRGVYLKAGTHQVIMEFRLRSFTWGLAISALTALVCAVALLCLRRGWEVTTD